MAISAENNINVWCYISGEVPVKAIYRNSRHSSDLRASHARRFYAKLFCDVFCASRRT